MATFNYFYLDVSTTHATDLLSENISPKRYHHHNRQGGEGWSVEYQNGRTRITLSSDYDESIITLLLLKA